ncbi:MAG TPA: SPOR domain-containing protein [Rhodanobacteraceae bacterium]|nr:SPOR domain-containing protein [Rhodanobacteraceae bacterium]
MATRNNRQAVRNGGAAFPGWALFLAGVVVGGIVMALAYRGMPSLRRMDQPQANPNAVAQQGGSPGIAASSSAASSASQFDFYKVLPEKEVVIPNAELSAMAKAEQQKAAAANNASASTPTTASANTGTTSSQGTYVLQVGAYPDSGAADAKKAELALRGFSAHVQTIALDGKTWNRVRLGPFATATELQAMQKKLQAAGFQAMPMKEK